MAYNKFITTDGLVLLDLTADTVTANKLPKGITAHDRSGTPIIGTVEVNSAIPIEVSTEAEMTVLLESGEIGGVYKYTGTTGTYENGALYVLEESVDTYIQIGGSTTDTIDLNQYYGQTWASLGDVDLRSLNGNNYRLFAHQVTYCYISTGNQYILQDGNKVQPTDIISGVYTCDVGTGGSND